VHNLTSLGLALTMLACGGGGSATDGGVGSDSGSDVHKSDLTQTGQIVDFVSGAPVPYAVVAGPGIGNPSDANGRYSFLVPAAGGPFVMQAGGPPDASTSYVTFVEQDMELLGDANDGKTAIVPTALEMQIRGMLTYPPGASLAIVRILVEGLPSCPDVTGATISVPNLAAPDAGPNSGKPKLVYFAGSPAMPSASATSVAAGAVPSAVLYDLLPVQAYSQITVQHPTCKQVPFPVQDPAEPNIQYAGGVDLQPSATPNEPYVDSEIRIFLQ
jgi:hypothetical protein